MYDGYESARIWDAYYAWVQRRIADSRALALEDVRPPPTLQGYGFSMLGPRGRAYDVDTGGVQSGANFSFDRQCPHSPGAGECVWVFRYATGTRWDAALTFVRANFDVAHAAEYLRTNGVEPNPRFAPQSFGLPDPLANGPLPYAGLKQVTALECEGVTAALAVATRIREEINVSGREPRRRGDPPPPPRPHAAMFDLTLPPFYVQRRGSTDVVTGTLTISTYGGDSFAATASREILAPVTQCPAIQARQEE